MMVMLKPLNTGNTSNTQSTKLLSKKFNKQSKFNTISPLNTKLLKKRLSQWNTSNPLNTLITKLPQKTYSMKIQSNLLNKLYTTSLLRKFNTNSTQRKNIKQNMRNQQKGLSIEKIQLKKNMIPLSLMIKFSSVKLQFYTNYLPLISTN